MARRSRRRGALLLIVLTLLVLFLLVGLAFIVSAGQFARTQDADARSERTGMPGPKLASEALYQVLRGTQNPYSVVGAHSLLEDLYGRDFLVGQIRSRVESIGENEIQQFRFSPIRFGDSNEDAESDAYYGGCVLTFLTGNARGHSTRVLNYEHGNRGARRGLHIDSVMVPDPVSGELRPPDVNSRFLINGRPFNGVGAGQTDSGDWSTVSGVPIAFAPNHGAYRHAAPLEEILHGGQDEAWDAVDFQNMFLAKAGTAAKALHNAHDSQSADPESPDYMAPNLRRYLLRSGGNTPSFHRPYLLEFLRRRGKDIINDTTLRRQVMMRPLPEDHPAFTGGNPNFDPVRGPWDVDNDGDGIADSIWLDFGLSALTGPDGRLYKPLVAPLIVDLDGRINLNTADSLEHATARNKVSLFSPKHSVTDLGPLSGIENNFPLSNSNNSFGLGFGPADISLPHTPLLSTLLLRSRYAGREETFVESPDVATSFDESATPGKGPNLGSFTNYRSDSDDDVELAQRKTLSNAFVPDFYLREDQLSWMSGRQGSLTTGFGSPADLHARGIPFLDPTGNMLWFNVGALDGTDDPYEIGPLQRTAEDDLYSLTDLEGLLRHDASSIRRNSRLGPSDLGAMFWSSLEDSTQHAYTTHSVSIPAPPTAQHINGTLARSIRKMFVAKIQQAGYAGNANVLVTLLNLVPPELARGEKLDINRALYSGATRSDRSHLLEKAQFARHLYHLMMLLTDVDFVMPTRESLSREDKQRLHTQRIAQWAINVVDFADADSVMTPFVYDEMPFDDHRVENYDPFDPRPRERDRRIVWGCEHPELLLSESLAFHDRRVQDTDDDPSGNRRASESPDPDLDQVMPPQGSLFIELLCVRGSQPPVDDTTPTAASRAPEDIYERIGGEAFLDLDKAVPQSTDDLNVSVQSKPVWRIAISKMHYPASRHENLDKIRLERPDQATFTPEDLGRLTETDDHLERFIWFSRSGPAVARPDLHAVDEERPRNTYFNQSATPSRVRPGQYVVVGPRPMTPIGLKRPTEPYAQVIDLSTMNHSHADGSSRRAPAPVVSIIARTAERIGHQGQAIPSVGCSVSEPTAHEGYYPQPTDEPFYTDAAGVRQPLDRPLDSRSWQTLIDSDGMSVPQAEQRPLRFSGTETGTRQNFRTIFLQRLADPGYPWHPIANPYQTVDWMPVDLTVFNSLEERQPDLEGKPFDRDDPHRVAPPIVDRPGRENLGEVEEGPVLFASREKDDRTSLDDPKRFSASRFNVFSNATYNDPGIPAEPWDRRGQRPVPNWEEVTQNRLSAEGEKEWFDPGKDDVPHTLGWVNRHFFARELDSTYDRLLVLDGKIRVAGPYAGTPYGTDPLPNNILGYSAAELPIVSRNVLGTYPSLVWHNRPYANIYELMLVPACSQSRLTHEFTTSRWQDPYSSTFEGSYDGAFGHLLNFFYSSTFRRSSANYHRIFDFVRVPSRFRETSTTYRGGRNNRSTFDQSQTRLGSGDELQSYTKFREPGRINLNTAFANEVWDALGFDGMIGPDIYEHRRRFERSMAGGIRKDERYPDGQYPSEYPYPFKPSTTMDLAPTLGKYSIKEQASIDSSLLRSNFFGDGVARFKLYRHPLLAEFAQRPTRDALGGTSEQPRVSPTAFKPFGHPIQNRRNNAYFRFKDILKVGGSVSAQSNVFAIWLTVGFFEVEPNYPENDPSTGQAYFVDNTHPDGYRYGAERGSQLGEVKRHRAFYLVDRSIPVAFEPGMNHNVDKAILMHRQLE